MPTKQKSIKVLIYPVNMPPYEFEIDNTLTPLQKLVGGFIEFVRVDPGIGLIVNEEGKLRRLSPNRMFRGDMLMGTIVAVGDQRDGEFCSLTDEQIARLHELLG